jgi:hypothetical protein
LRLLQKVHELQGMKRLVALVALVLAGLARAGAGLGDSDEKIDDMYGNVLERHLRDDGSVSVLYQKGRYLYFVVFANRRSVLERYSHLNGTALSEREIARFLKANVAGAAWSPAAVSSIPRRFVRSDGGAEATYATVDGRPTLTIRQTARKSRASRFAE